jgi:hypothetical protein
MVGERTLQDAHRIAALARGGFGNSTNSLRSRLRIVRDDPVGDAFFNAALRRANSLKGAFRMARSLVLRRELREGFEPSRPQMAGGWKSGALAGGASLGHPRARCAPWKRGGSSA